MTDTSPSPVYTWYQRTFLLPVTREHKSAAVRGEKIGSLYSVSLSFLPLPNFEVAEEQLRFEVWRQQRRKKRLAPRQRGFREPRVPTARSCLAAPRLHARRHCWHVQNTTWDFFRQPRLSSLINSCSTASSCHFSRRQSSVLRGSGAGVRKGTSSATVKPVEKVTAKELTVTYMEHIIWFGV